jgi:hypothetical protein
LSWKRDAIRSQKLGEARNCKKLHLTLCQLRHIHLCINIFLYLWRLAYLNLTHRAKFNRMRSPSNFMFLAYISLAFCLFKHVVATSKWNLTNAVAASSNLSAINVNPWTDLPCTSKCTMLLTFNLELSLKLCISYPIQVLDLVSLTTSLWVRILRFKELLIMDMGLCI